jgi:uncharacterized phage protein (TIGR01671 family)
MREIKFRAWNIVDEDIGAAHMMQPKDLSYEPINLLQKTPDHIQLMQYTGLKDKNGKEIYEGDIVQRLWSDGTVCNQFAVKWLEDNCGYNITPALLKATKRPQTTTHTAQGFTVIGNIYENKELLK